MEMNKIRDELNEKILEVRRLQIELTRRENAETDDIADGLKRVIATLEQENNNLKASKGRTGLMVSAYLVYSGMSAKEALQVYAHKRTTNNEGVSIPSQRHYVGYWENTVSIPRGVDHGPPSVNSPEPCSRELVRIRLYDTVNTGSVFFVVSELQEVPGQRYCPPVEVFKSCCREVKKGCVRPNSSRYYLSFVDQGGEGNRSEPVEPHLIVQMDTESSVLYQKTCIDCCFEKPIKVPYITTALMDAKLGTEGRKDVFDWLSRQLSGLSNFLDAVNLNYVLFQIVMRDGCDL
ncbi:unnamed protein product [Camellia sinensis]